MLRNRQNSRKKHNVEEWVFDHKAFAHWIANSKCSSRVRRYKQRVLGIAFRICLVKNFCMEISDWYWYWYGQTDKKTLDPYICEPPCILIKWTSSWGLFIFDWRKKEMLEKITIKTASKQTSKDAFIDNAFHMHVLKISRWMSNRF